MDDQNLVDRTVVCNRKGAPGQRLRPVGRGKKSWQVAEVAKLQPDES
jgi:hypothetical protein